MNPLLSFSVVWARVALGFYLAGLCATVSAALLQDSLRQRALFGLGRGAIAAGFLFQFVCLVETLAAAPPTPVNVYRLATALLAFVIAAFFLSVYRANSPRALGLLIVPLLCMLAGAASFAPVLEVNPGDASVAASLAHSGWIYVHIGLIFLGYAGLLIAVSSGILYLISQRGLKSKNRRMRPHRLLPPLETLDVVSYRSLLTGFPLLTAGLLIGAYWADRIFGGIRFTDPTVLLALMAWAVYLILLFARWSAGWRGRRSAYLTLVCFALALAGWFANGASGVHSMFLH